MAKVHHNKNGKSFTGFQHKTKTPVNKSRKDNQQPILRNTPLLILIFIVATIVFFIFQPALSAQALSFDDQLYLVSNRLVQNPGLASVGRFLREILKPSTIPGYYQPLNMISLMTDYAMGGRVNNLKVFHISSLTIHILNTSLVIIFLYLLFGNYWIAALAGMLFGIHPITVETIPWIGERKTLLAAFFALLSLIFYLRYIQKKSVTPEKNTKNYFLLSLSMYFCALLSKPTSVPLPVIMLLLDYWPFKRLNKQSLVEKSPFLAIGVISAIVTYLSQKYTAGIVLPGEQHSGNVLLVICYNITFYLSKIFWPHNMSSLYPFPSPFTISNPEVLTSIAGTILLIILLAFSLRWTKAFFTGWLVFFTGLFPAMGVIGFTNVIASDKYAYLPVIGILISLAWFLNILWSKLTTTFHQFSRGQIIIVAVIIILGITEGIITHNCLAYWKDSETLFRYMLKSAPESPILHDSLGYLLLKKNNLEEAISHFKEAIRVDPNFYKSYNNLGIVLAYQGKYDEAISYYRKGTKLNPKFAEAYNNLGVAFERQGKTDEALTNYRKAIELNPNYASAYFNLGNLLNRQGKPEEAIINFQETLKIEPQDAGAWGGLGLIYARQGKMDKAIEAFRKTKKLMPHDPEVHYNLGLALSIQGILDEAIICFKEAIKLNPELIDAYNNLGMALAIKGDINEAIAVLEKSMQIDPNNPNTQLYLKSVLELNKETK